MAYLVIEDFRGGVDRRRPIYAAKPGTLWVCENAHITMGGDIEKRKAFVARGAFDDDTFGLFPQGDVLYTFGSVASPTVPGGVTYQRLQYVGAEMTALIDVDLFAGKIYAIARFGDGSVQHFYDGVLVAAWNDGIARAWMGSINGIATALAAIIDASANYVATAALNVITVTAATAGVPFTVETLAENGGVVDDETLTNAAVTANVAPVTAVAASFTFPVRGGPGASNLTALTVGGVEALGASIAWATSDSNFATLIANQINTFVSAPNYTATATNDEVTITASVTGIAANGLSVVATTTGDARAGNQSAAGTNDIGSMSGGVAAVAAVAQVNTLTVGGTFDPGDRFGVKLTRTVASIPSAEYFGNFAKPWGNANCVKTHKRKMYSGAESFLHFSGVNNPTLLNVDVDAGAGFLNIANHDGGSEDVLSLESYQGRLAPFSRHTIQLWTMQNDDDLNALDQVMRNTGTRSPRASLEFAGNDVFYLDDSGIRSIRARDASNNAYASGVGASINELVREWMREEASEEEIEGARAVVEPEEARFWMSIGSRIFVYSWFPDSNVAAWSWYSPGFVVEDFAIAGNRVWVRAGDQLYLYGGSSGEEYGSDYTVTVEMPFTTANKAGTFKSFLSMDIAAEGTWSCRWRINPNNLDQVVRMGSYAGVTFNKPGWDGVGDTTHIAPVFTHSGVGYASLSQVGLFYQGGEESN